MIQKLLSSIKEYLLGKDERSRSEKEHAEGEERDPCQDYFQEVLLRVGNAIQGEGHGHVRNRID
jgi:hypothetical protein